MKLQRLPKESVSEEEEAAAEEEVKAEGPSRTKSVSENKKKY